MVPKRLSDNALDSVSVCCRPAVLFRDGEAQSRLTALVVPAQNRKPFVSAARGFFEHPPIRRSIQQPLVFTKAVR